jgi:1,6-anhydro-N-acetylmuramate kinase
MRKTAAKSLAASMVLFVAAISAASAQSFSEPAAYEAAHPDRDVLNGGALTPEAQMRRGGQTVPFGAAVGQAPAPIVSRSRHRHRRSE